jgi:adenine deaminase
MAQMFMVSGNIADVLNSRIFAGTIIVKNGKISQIKEEKGKKYDNYILPGFVNSHVHIESSMLAPSEFARIAVSHGVVAVVSDPHEIANVLGIKGVNYMIDNSKNSNFKFFFGAPSCVPATSFETSGAKLCPKEIRSLLKNPKIKYLAEMMNYPGVINKDSDVMEKIKIAHELKKNIDGHAPGLSGEGLKKYTDAGISTDHECFTLNEALEKINLGMKILIREGSAAKNFEALSSLIESYPDKCMLCSDDLHPDDLMKGSINIIVKKAIKKKYDLMNILKVACVNPVIHYGLDIGLLRKNDSADFIIIDDLKKINVLKTYINGILVNKYGKSCAKRSAPKIANNFNVKIKKPKDFEVIANNKKEYYAIGATDGNLVTEKIMFTPKVFGGRIIADTKNDILKISVVNRYNESSVSSWFVNGFGLKKGAIASSIAHDSHNIIGVGANDADLCTAVNLVIKNKGGIAYAVGKESYILKLPIAGLMSNRSAVNVAKDYEFLNNKAKQLGCKLCAPFMTLSFMALLVIPKLKLSDKGLFDSEKFKFEANN